ncbi:flagellin [Clostridium niameyense]|uniref:Flagellin n=1 Tax=Clostridium niameyense TaxID=1622073 RepID=A0A6M0R6T4_9CLOT|nr:flagellin [Clostridium niameyense]NEZ45884.1 flagellin [Clostridium niameyense]
MRLNHNLASLDVFRAYSRTVEEQSVALDKITSGYKVRNAKDDPNVIAQSEKTRIQIRGLQMARRNAQDGVSLLQTAEGGIESITSMIQRIRELTVQAGDAAMSDNDKEVLLNEVNQMLEAIDDTAKNTEFNKVKLLHTDITREVPVGNRAGETVEIKFKDMSADKLGLKGTKGVVEEIKNGKIGNALKIIDTALEGVLSTRSEYGALENRFEDVMVNLDEITFKMERADSNLRDSDIAEEMMIYVKDDILIQSSMSIMHQTNNFPMDVLKILENVRGK